MIDGENRETLHRVHQPSGHFSLNMVSHGLAIKWHEIQDFCYIVQSWSEIKTAYELY